MRHLRPFLTRLVRSRRPQVILLALSFTALAVISLAVISGWRAWKGYEYHLDQASANTSNLAKALAQHAEDAFKTTDIVLLNLVERVENDRKSPAALSRLHQLFVHTTQQFPQFQGMFLFNHEGRYIASAQDALPANLHVADREYFLFHEANPSRDTHIGHPVLSRTLGKWMIPVSRRVSNADGSFGGVVLITIEMEYFKKFHNQFDIGNKGIIVLMFDNGIHVTRRPFNDGGIGKRIQNGAFEAGYLQKNTGTFIRKSALDGTEKVYAYQRLEDYPLLAVTALAKDEVLAEWMNVVYTDAVILILLVTILGFLAFRLIRQISFQLHTENMLLRAQHSLHKLNQAYESLAMQDSLTELPNRRHFDQIFRKEFERAQRHRTPLSLLMIDVDHFKRFNDIYGHPAGDACLKAIGHKIRADLFRPADFPARYGGEEFVVLLPETAKEGAIIIADRLRHAISELHIQHSGNTTGFVTISIGLSTLFESNKITTLEKLIDAADKALYQAKAVGRNLVFCNPEN
jgi:diguanylate cyclase (GGDEF)-like protein